MCGKRRNAGARRRLVRSRSARIQLKGQTIPNAADPLIVSADERTIVAEPLSDEEFARQFAPAGPFESEPHIAVAVSGGPDSMALTLLCDTWARARGGRITGLTVDHRLRPESRAEARQVGAWLAARGIAHHILRRPGPRPNSAVQARARAARSRLLAVWCCRVGVLHLLTGHQREDQAETLLHRLASGSGTDGLAAMQRVLDVPGEVTGGVRLIRPLLRVPRARLEATLARRDQAWIEDPSNRDAAYARTRLGSALSVLAPEGLSAERLANTAARIGRDRAALEGACADLLAAAASPHPAGFVRLERARWAAAPPAVSLRALQRLLLAVGGRSYPPRSDRLERLHQALREPAEPRAATLGGCRIIPAAGGLLVCREAAAANESLTLKPGGRVLWDGRFVVSLGRSRVRSRVFHVRRLGRVGVAELRRRLETTRGESLLTHVPAAARPSLPAIFHLDALHAVPHLGLKRLESGGGPGCGAVYHPRNPMAPTAFG